MDNRTSGFDIIGEIHGHAGELKASLSNMRYSRHGRGYRHEDRKVVFVGDFVDRGPAIGEVPAASEILDRFLQSAEIMKITGRSYRLKNAEKRSKGAKAPTGSEAE